MALARIRPTGLNVDIPAYDVPPEFWTGMTGMSFDDIQAEQVSGWRYIYDENAAEAAPLFVMNNLHLGVNYWMYGTADKVAVTTSSGVHHDLTPGAFGPSGTGSEDWNGAELNGYPVISWGGFPHSWDRSTSSNCQYLTGWPSAYLAKIIRAHRFHLFALNISGGVEWPSVVMWSDAAAPGALPDNSAGGGAAGDAWTAGTGSEAGNLSLGDTSKSITDGLSLGENFIVYKTGSAYQIYPTGDSFIYGQRMLLRTMGALATNCVTEWQSNHLVFGDGDIYITDGQNLTRSIVDKQTRRTIFNELSNEQYERTFVCGSPNTNEIYFCYAVDGAPYPNKALVWDSSSGTTQFKDAIDIFGANSFRNLAIGGSGTPHIAPGNISTDSPTGAWSAQTDDWQDRTDTWDQNASQENLDGLVGIDHDNSKLIEFNVNDTQPVGQITARISRESLDFGDSASVKLLTEIWPKIIGTDSDVIQVRAGSQMEPYDPITWTEYQPYTIGSSKKIDTFARGRLISVEFLAQGARNWRCAGFDLNIEPAGRY